MDEGKGLSVETSLFRQRPNFQILRKEKKKIAITWFNCQKHRQYTSYFWFWVRVTR